VSHLLIRIEVPVIFSLVRFALVASIPLLGLAARADQLETMRAVQYGEYGASSVLQVVEVPRPRPRPGEALIRVDAASINNIDWANRQTAIPGFSSKLPAIPGYDFAGEIVELSDDVDDRHIGEHVFAMLPLDSPGAYAEYVRVPARLLAVRPKNVDALHAAAVPLTALTAWQALVETGHLKAGQTVLIHGAAGGVGHLAVQLAKHIGAHVIGTSSASNLDFVRGLGAETTVDYRTQKFEDIAKDVDLILDTVGGDTLVRSLKVVRKGGMIVSIAGAIDPQQAAKLGVEVKSILVRPDASQLKQIAALMEQGALKAEIDTIYPLRDAAFAHDKSERRHVRGKLVLKVNDTAVAKH
jgi:NADPH:quinone reductase-like Zn-dependent oxidoreductase